MLKSALTTIKKNNMLCLNDRIIIGVSGGPDSMALLNILYTLSDEFSLKLYVAHLNHMLRGQESDEDTKYVIDFCKKINVSCTIKYVDINDLSKKTGLSLEEAGRKARYDLFLETAEKFNANKIALAHNMNDQAETVIMRIMRGTGLDGLCGIRPFREGLYIRPLLYTTRDEIEQYCQDKLIYPRIDSTNLKILYSRNRVRLEMIPYIKKNFNTNIINSLSSMAELLTLDNDFIDGCVNDIYKQKVQEGEGRACIEIKCLEDIHDSLKRRVIRKIIEKVKGNLTGIESKHIELIFGIIANGSTGAAVELPGRLRAQIFYNKLEVAFLSKKSNIVFCKKVMIPGTTFIDEIDGMINSEIIENKINYCFSDSCIKYFDFDKINGDLNVRTKMDGDFIVPFGMQGKKKIKKLFIDSKISRENRGSIPLISSKDEIVWVIGLCISNNFKIDSNTKKVLKLEFIQSGGNKND